MGAPQGVLVSRGFTRIFFLGLCKKIASMEDIDDILLKIGYTDIPDISGIKIAMVKDFPSWFKGVNFEEALDELRDALCSIAAFPEGQ